MMLTDTDTETWPMRKKKKMVQKASEYDQEMLQSQTTYVVERNIQPTPGVNPTQVAGPLKVFLPQPLTGTRISARPLILI